MKILRESSENEMILEFLKAESTSERFCQQMKNTIEELGLDESSAEYIKNGGTFPKLFFLTSDYENFVIVEGHFRMTAYALVPECFNDVEVIVGKCDSEELNLWM